MGSTPVLTPLERAIALRCVLVNPLASRRQIKMLSMGVIIVRVRQPDVLHVLHDTVEILGDAIYSKRKSVKVMETQDSGRSTDYP